jgi:hypothetical protein
MSVMQGRPEIQKNIYATDPTRNSEYKLPMVLTEAARSIGCFDCEAYARENEDLPQSWDCRSFFDHYINYGQFEGRPYRCDCLSQQVLAFPPPPTLISHQTLTTKHFGGEHCG